MNHYKALFLKYPMARQFLFFNLVFYLAMALSRSVHSLWFESQGSLSHYGLSYSAMAFAGMFAAYIGKKTADFPTRLVIRFGVCLYAVGLFLRIFYQSALLAILSGFISGIGAAVVILLLRIWVIQIGERGDRATVVSLKKFSNGLGTSLGGLVSGVLIYLLTLFLQNNSLPILLVLASLICLSGIFLVPELDGQLEEEATTPTTKQVVDKPGFKWWIISFGLLAGLMASLFSPYIPVLLKRQGLSVAMVGPVLTGMSLLGIVASSLFSGQKVDDKKSVYYFWSEMALAGLTLLFGQPIGIYLLIFVLAVRVFFVQLSTITQELMELAIYPKESLSYFYGLSQTSYFIGDSLGGFLGGWLYEQNMTYSLLLFAFLVLVNALLFSRFYRISKAGYYFHRRKML